MKTRELRSPGEIEYVTQKPSHRVVLLCGFGLQNALDVRASADGSEGLVGERAVGVGARLHDVVVVIEGAAGQVVAAQICPEVLDRVV